MKDYNVDLLDGFDGREIVYDEKAEKSYHARIWWALFIAAVLILLRGVTFHLEEIKLVQDGEMILASYHEPTAQATYIEENGTYHQYDISGFTAQYNGDKIPLYYEEDIAAAQPVHVGSFWMQTYLFFGGATLLCGWRLWRIYRR